MSYTLLDSGHGRKLENFGGYTLIRPAGGALWHPKNLSWQADARFSREQGNRWYAEKPLPKQWEASLGGLKFQIALTDFGHLGLFPEHSMLWEKITAWTRPSSSILNLFAYSGGATLVAARCGGEVCHVDASKGMVAWARENAFLNSLDKAPIRWIIDDVCKFLSREIRRGKRYDGIIVDPPSFGRGAKGEVFVLEEGLLSLLSLCRQVLSPSPSYVIFTSHTQGVSPVGMHHLLSQMMEGWQGTIESGELTIASQTGMSLPSGYYATWAKATLT